MKQITLTRGLCEECGYVKPATQFREIRDSRGRWGLSRFCTACELPRPVHALPSVPRVADFTR